VRQHQRRLTAAEKVAVAQQYQAGAEMRGLAVAFGVHRTSISRVLHDLGVTLRGQDSRAENVSAAARLYEAGWSLARLGEKYGCAHTTIRQSLREYGVTMRPRRGWEY
jgi:lambda repressor-like predicted transcriptional regulator